jgi:hypothetical protein
MEREIVRGNLRAIIGHFAILTCTESSSLRHVEMLNSSPCIDLPVKRILAFLNLGKLKGGGGGI